MNNTLVRIRALDQIEPIKDHFIKYNAVFKSSIPEFDVSFDRGTPLDLNYYICRNSFDGSTFEEEFLDIIFSRGKNQIGKISILQGDVGSGKTSFVRYLHKIMIPKLLPNTLSVYFDTWNIFGTERLNESIEKAFIIAVEKEITLRKVFAENQQEYYSKVLSFLGYKNLSDQEIFRMGQKLRSTDILEFLLISPHINQILIIFDNIDESSNNAMEVCKEFILKLSNIARNYEHKMTNFLVPLRKYSVNRFSDTERFAPIRLMPIDGKLVVRSHLEKARNEIASASRPYREVFTYTIRDNPDLIDLSFKNRLDRDKMQARTISFSKENICDLLQELTDEVLSIREPEFLALIRNLSAGNMKILVGNMYNILHSAKFPLTPIYARRITPDNAVEKNQGNLIPFNLAIECLLAIHYPFYDVESSHLINIFNAASKPSYQNTLVIPRILSYLMNLKQIKYKDLCTVFNEIGYNDLFIKSGLKKCIYYGLININNGYDIKHMEADTIISASSAARLYMSHLLIEPSYLQYICEDTPMYEKYCVPVIEKYKLDELRGSKNLRFEGVRNLIEFIELEEQDELRVVGDHEKLKGFLIEANFHNEKTSVISLSSLLKTNVLPIINRIS